MVANEDTIVVIRRNSRLVFKSAHLTAEGSSASRISNTFFRKTKLLLGNPEDFCFLTCFRLSAIFSRTIRLCLSFSKVMNTLVTSYDFLVKYKIFGNGENAQKKAHLSNEIQFNVRFSGLFSVQSYLCVELFDTL